jgi:hypothetical protein
MNLRYITIVAAMILIFSTASAEDGTTAYEFLNVSPSSHVYGLGGHNITIIDDDINLIEQNPALLGPEIGKQVGVSYMHYLGTSNFMGARFGSSAGEHAGWAVGIQYFGYGSMTETDEGGNVLGTFSPSDIAINATYSHDINDRIRGGINMKVVHSNYGDYNATAICTDLGVNYYNPDNDCSLSLVLKNLGGQVKKFNDTYDKLPWDVQVGWSQTMAENPIRLSVTATNLTKWKLPYYTREDNNSTTSALVEKNNFGSNLFRHLTFAVELVPNERMYVGLGYSYKTRTDMTVYARNFVSGFSIAAGLKTSSFGVGIALAQPHVGGTTFMANFTMSLSDLLH